MRRFVWPDGRVWLLPVALAVCVILAPRLLAQSTASSYRQAVLAIQQRIESNDLNGARGLLAAALRRYPDNGGLENLLGIVEAEQGEIPLARQAFSAAIQHSPKLVSAYLNLGRIEMKSAGSDAAQRRQALSLYRKVLRMDPANGEANFQAATLLMWDGQYAASLAHLDRLGTSMHGRIRVQSLRCADEAGLGRKAATDRAAAAMVANPDLRERDAVFVLPVLRAAHRADLIDKLFTEANAHEPLSAEGMRVLGLAKEAEGKPAQATAVLERAFALDDTQVAPLVDLTRIAMAGKQYKQALGFLAHARALDPKDAGFAYEYGLICLKLDLLGEARRAMSEAVKLSPDTPEYYFALGVLSAHVQGAYEGLQYLRKYHQMRPADPDGVLALGTAYFDAGNYTDALPWLRQAASNSRTAASAHYYLGRVFRQQGNYQQAVAQLKQAAALLPNRASIFAELGQTYVQMHDYLEAQKQLQHALALNANNYTANFALLRLYAQTHDSRFEAQQARFREIMKQDHEQHVEQYREEMRVIEARPQVELKYGSNLPVPSAQ